MSLWRISPGETQVHVQLTSLKISQKLIAQATMVRCQLTSARVCVTPRAMKTVRTATADQTHVSSSLDSQKHQTYAVLLDVVNMVLALHDIWEADSRCRQMLVFVTKAGLGRCASITLVKRWETLALDTGRVLL